MPKKILFIFFAVISFLVNGCRKELKNPFWDVDAMVPLVKSTLSISNLIPDSLLQQNPDNSLDVVYSTSLYSFSSDSLFLIPDTTLDTLLPLFPATLPPCSTIIPPSNDETKYSLGDVQLTRIDLRSGKMKIEITNNISGNIEFNYQLPLTTLNSVPYDITFVVPARVNATPGYYSFEVDLAGYSIDLRGLSGTGYNTLVKNISAKVPCSEPAINLLSGDYIKIENHFTGIVPQYAKGYFGNSVSVAGPDTSALSLFSHFTGGSLQLEDVDIDFSIENSVGADARIQLNNLSSINTRTGNSISLNHSVIGSPININRSTDNNGTVIPSVYKVSFNPSNSNIKPFIENLPDRLSYQLEVEINPLGNVSGNNDFIYYDKLLKTEFNMQIPLSFIASELALADTVNFSLGENCGNINSGILYLHAENGFPFSAQVQLYPMNSTYQILDSLIGFPNTLSEPPLDANLIAAGKKYSVLIAPLDETKLNLLRNATKYLYIKLKFNTAFQPNYIKIYSFYEINLKVSADFNYTVGK